MAALDPPPSLVTALMMGQGLFPCEPVFVPAVPAPFPFPVPRGAGADGGLMGGDG
jgi:hypothetical protein